MVAVRRLYSWADDLGKRKLLYFWVWRRGNNKYNDVMYDSNADVNSGRLQKLMLVRSASLYEQCKAVRVQATQCSASASSAEQHYYSYQNQGKYSAS
jgi:hypothetical protein